MRSDAAKTRYGALWGQTVSATVVLGVASYSVVQADLPGTTFRMVLASFLVPLWAGCLTRWSDLAMGASARVFQQGIQERVPSPDHAPTPSWMLVTLAAWWFNVCALPIYMDVLIRVAETSSISISPTVAQMWAFALVLLSAYQWQGRRWLAAIIQGVIFVGVFLLHRNLPICTACTWSVSGHFRFALIISVFVAAVMAGGSWMSRRASTSG
jgi:hypothetical protein